MHILLALGVTLLTATVPNQSQAALVPTPPVNITFVKASFEEAVSFIARFSGVTIELDQTVSGQVRREIVAESPILLRGATLEQALETLTSLKGLSYSIVGPQAVRIFKR